MKPDNVVVGIDNGASKNSAAVMDADGRFLLDRGRWFEIPSRVSRGPAAVGAMAEAMDRALASAASLAHGSRPSASTPPARRPPTA